MSTSEIQEDTSAGNDVPINTGSKKVKDFLDMFSEMTDKKLPTLPSIPRESHLARIKNYCIWKERMLSVLDSYDRVVSLWRTFHNQIKKILIVTISGVALMAR